MCLELSPTLGTVPVSSSMSVAGGVVWTLEFEPIGQFRQFNEENCTTYITSFEQLVELGYKLSQIEEDTQRAWLVGNQS